MTASNAPPPSATPPQPPTRSRSRTLPSSEHSRPDFLKSNSNTSFPLEQDDEEESDEENKCQIRRGSGPLLDPYGVPIQNKIRYARTNNNVPLVSSPFASPPINQPQPPPPAATAAASSSIGQSDLNQKIRVCVRKRPLNKKELERCEKDIAPTAGVRSININEPK